jgi:hypothetical protein
MSILMHRMAVIFAAALVPFAFAAIVTPAVSFADCQGGQWWDPVSNACQPLPVQPLGCENGWWWDPVANVCRPPVGPPLFCDNGWWWDPVANVCRPPVIPPQ